MMAEKLAPDGAAVHPDDGAFSEAFARRMLGQPARRFAQCDKHFTWILESVQLHRAAHPEQSMDDAVDWALSGLFGALDAAQVRAFLARQRSLRPATHTACSRSRSAAPVRRVRVRTRERRSSPAARRTSSTSSGDSSGPPGSSDGDGDSPPPPHHPRRPSQDRRTA